MTSLIKSFWTDDSGQTLAEYAMLLGLIAIVVIVALTLLGNNLADFYDYIRTEFPGV